MSNPETMNMFPKWFNWVISLAILFLLVTTWVVLDTRWNTLNSLLVFTYVAVLMGYLVAEMVTYKGVKKVGKHTSEWLRYALLLSWLTLILVPLLEYGLFPKFNIFITAIGISLTVFGTLIRAWGVKTLGVYFSRDLDSLEDQKLIEKGPYKYVRHPAYTGNILQVIGIPLVLYSYFSLILSGVIIILFLQRINWEEEALEKKLPEYDDYKQRTNKLIPRIY
ncbi:MAG: methyltransferase family protein [Candidatus Saliniplasma sp.]